MNKSRKSRAGRPPKVEALLELLEYQKGKAVVYIRQIGDGDDALFYVGQTTDLTQRYGYKMLSEVIYFEYVEDSLQRTIREMELTAELASAGLPIAIGKQYSQYQSKTTRLQHAVGSTMKSSAA